MVCRMSVDPPAEASYIEENIPVRQLTASQCTKMSWYLDQPGELSADGHLKDYRGMAELFGYEKVYIDYLETLKDLKTVKLLKDWGQKPEATVGELCRVLRILEREDVIEDCLKQAKIPVDASVPSVSETAKSRPVPSKESPQEDLKGEKRPISFSTENVPKVEGKEPAELKPTTPKKRKSSSLTDDDDDIITVHDIESGSVTTYTACWCFAEEDAAFAEHLMNIYVKINPSTKFFIPQEHLPAGRHIYDATAQVIEERCNGKAVLIISPHFKKSKDCDFAMKFARTLDPGAREGNIIPIVRESNEKLPRILHGLTAIKIDRSCQKKSIWKQLTASVYGHSSSTGSLMQVFENYCPPFNPSADESSSSGQASSNTSQEVLYTRTMSSPDGGISSSSVPSSTTISVERSVSVAPKVPCESVDTESKKSGCCRETGNSKFYIPSVLEEQVSKSAPVIIKESNEKTERQKHLPQTAPVLNTGEEHSHSNSKFNKPKSPKVSPNFFRKKGKKEQNSDCTSKEDSSQAGMSSLECEKNILGLSTSLLMEAPRPISEPMRKAMAVASSENFPKSQSEPVIVQKGKSKRVWLKEKFSKIISSKKKTDINKSGPISKPHTVQKSNLTEINVDISSPDLEQTVPKSPDSLPPVQLKDITDVTEPQPVRQETQTVNVLVTSAEVYSAPATPPIVANLVGAEGGGSFDPRTLARSGSRSPCENDDDSENIPLQDIESSFVLLSVSNEVPTDDKNDTT